MLYYVVKVLLSAVVIVLISEIAKRSTFMGAIVASLPLTSLLAIIWIYVESGDLARISALSISTFWLVIPSLTLVLLLPTLLKTGMNFWLSVALSITATVLAYLAMLRVYKLLGIQI
jgi:uncharacterized membrane protein (GlpM family)